MKDTFGGRIKQFKKSNGQKWEVSLEFVPSSDKTLPLLEKWKHGNNNSIIGGNSQ